MARPLVIGLTGGIGTGKSTAAQILIKLGIPVHNADDAVHQLLGQGGAAVKPVARLFPEALVLGAIDRQRLGRLVFGHPERLRQLEAVLHPLVRKDERAFLRAAKLVRAPFVVLEIPLLFETGADARCDTVICMTAPRAVQQERVLSRKGMTLAKFKAIVRHQMPEAEKKRRANYVVSSAQGRVAVRRALKAIIAALRT